VTTGVSTPPKARRPLVWWGLGLLIVGVLLGVVGGALFVGSAGADVIRTFTAPIRDTPLDVTIDLDEGTYVVYEQTGAGRGNGPFPSNQAGSVTIAPDTVSVLNQSGESLPVETTTFDETIDRNNSTFTGAVRFTVEESGVHRVLVDGVGQQVIVAPSIASSFGNAIAWLGIVALGALLAVIGLVLLIVGLVRGRRPAVTPVSTGAPVSLDPPAAAPSVAVQTTVPPAAPQGWYADPKGEARLRWWDGQQWTDYVS
jgi:hypothetical protein